MGVSTRRNMRCFTIDAYGIARDIYIRHTNTETETHTHTGSAYMVLIWP